MRDLDRLVVRASVEVRAAPAAVFAVVSDLRRKAALNPNLHVIRVELLGEEPIREGSIFYHRFQTGRRILEYRARVIRLVPPWLYVSRGETEPPFEVHVTVDPRADGCRLTQRELVPVTPGLVQAVGLSPGTPPVRDALGLLAFFPWGRRLGSELWAHQREQLVRRLTGELRAWLDAIRAHLEAPESRARGLGG